jgi:hypothetical protein
MKTSFNLREQKLNGDARKQVALWQYMDKDEPKKHTESKKKSGGP